nr:hypothetical protein [Tanacetum cinerariifolium]
MIFSTIKVVSRHQNTQQYGAMLPIELTNEEIRNTMAYKEYHAYATREAAPKPKASARMKRSSSGSFTTPPTVVASPRPTIAATPKLTAAAKGKQPAKAKSLSALSEVAMTEAEQLKLALKRSRQQMHISQPGGSGTDKGTGSKLGVQNVPSDDSEEEISWNSSDDEDSVNAQLEAEVLTRSSHSSRTSYAVAADLSEMELKKILIENMEGNKSIQRSDKQRNLYKALVDAYEADKTILDSYRDTIILKRRRKDDDDQEEGPSAGSDRGSKRWREGKEPELASAPLETATRSAGRSTTGSKSRQVSASADDQTIVQSSQHPEWFSQPKKPPTSDRDWNKTLPAVQGSTQTWISELAKQADSCSYFNELLDTPLDFSNFIMHRLRFDTLTPKLLVGPTYELMKGSCTSLIKLEYHLEEVYKATTDQLDWEPINYDKHALWGVSHWGRKRQQFYGFAVNREYALDVYSKRRIIVVTDLKIVEWHSYKHLDWITVRRDDDKLYKFKEGNFKRMFTRSIVIQRRVKDLQLGVKSYQKRLNLTKPDTYRSDLKRREAYTAYSNPRGFIY